MDCKILNRKPSLKGILKLTIIQPQNFRPEGSYDNLAMTCRLNYNIFDFEQIWRYFLKNLSTWVQLDFEVEHDFSEGLSSRVILKLSWRFSNLAKFEATFWKIWLPGCNPFLKFSMIFLEASPRDWFWNLFGDSLTWLNFYAHKNLTPTKRYTV